MESQPYRIWAGLVVSLALRGAVSAQAAPYAFPGFPWNEARIVREEKTVVVRGPDDRVACVLYANPRVALPRSLVVSNTADALVVDATAAFREGLPSLTLRSADFTAPELRNRDAVLRSDLGGVFHRSLEVIVAGMSRAGRYEYRKFPTRLKARPVPFDMIETWPDFKTFHFRWDFAPPEKGQASGPIFFRGCQWGTLSDLPARARPERGERPAPLFALTFEGTAEAERAKGKPQPVCAQGLAFTRGFRGQGVRLTAAARSRLEYAAAGNLDPEEGTLLFWYRPDWRGRLPGDRPSRTVLSYPPCSLRERAAGEGRLWCWWWGARYRGDLGDDAGNYAATGPLEPDGGWHHYAYTWGPKGVKIYRDGRRLVRRGLNGLPTKEAQKRPREPYSFARRAFDVFSVGCNGGGEQIDGVLDEVRLYRGAMDDAEVAAFYAADANPYECPSVARGGDFGARTLVDAVTLDAPTVARLRAQKRFRSEGRLASGACEGRPFLEAAEPRGRFCVRFNLETNAPLHVFEIDYPDDRKRTADLAIERSADPKDEYTMDVGYMTGDEIPVSGRMLTHRCLYWTTGGDVAVIAMSPRDDAPAAVAAIRVYRVDRHALPVARITPPSPGGGRSFGIHFEDISIGYCFGTPRTTGLASDELATMIDRCAATMKFTAQDLLCYPGAWYGDLMGRDGYDPRHNHAPDYLSRWYERFDREGLGLMPTIHGADMPIPEDLVDRRSFRDGSLHDSPLAIHATGYPNPGLSHGSPATFCFAHPAVQARIRDLVGTLVRQGVSHPSFRGVSLHLASHYYLWWGRAESGYNDYCIDAFAKATGIEVPADRSDPLRGKAYYDWLRAHAWERWLDWRCETLARFYGELARSVKRLRPDLRFVLNSFQIVQLGHPDYLKDDYMARQNREAGLDRALLAKYAPEVTLCQTSVPCDYRWRRDFRYPRENRSAIAAHLRTADLRKDYYGLLDRARDPWINLHDIYWEDAVDYLHVPWKRPDDPALRIDGDGFADQPWRVGTINAGGAQALRPFAVPLFHRDILTFTKGGFLIGTYGMEERLVPFMQAFRALPNVLMEDVKTEGTIRLRRIRRDGRIWFALVNGDGRPGAMTVDLPCATSDVVTGERFAGTAVIRLPGYGLRVLSGRLSDSEMKNRARRADSTASRLP